MMLRSIFAVLVFSVFALATPANAATSVYVDSSHPNYGGFADATNAGDSLGPADGQSATVPLGGFIAYLVSETFTTVDFDITFTGVTGAGTVRLYVGQTNGGTGFTTLNSRFFTVSNGLNNLSSAALSTYCAGLTGGCNTFVVQAWTATSFGIDSVPSVNPEPSSWALMIAAFVMFAARLKTVRKRRALVSGHASPAFA